MKGCLYATVVALTIIALGTLRAQTAHHIVLSEAYGGGGNSGSIYKYDYVELYNPTNSAVTMTNWSLQYASAAGSFGPANTTIFSGTIAAHSFFLIQEAQGAGGSANLPTPDAVGSVNLSAANGKLALANDRNSVTGPAGSNVVDFMGYGTANQFEGSAAVAALGNTTSAERKALTSSTALSMAAGGSDELKGNGYDANDNAGDFVPQTIQVPQNSSSSAEVLSSGNQPPGIVSVTRVSFVPSVGAVDSVKATITDDGVVVSARLHVRVNGGTYDSSLTMSVLSGSTYAAVIPAGKHTANGALVEYFVSAIDDSSKYSSTIGTQEGYFVGDAPVSSIKSKTLSNIIGYGAKINGIVNVATNTFSNGQGYLQDATGGFRIFQAGGLPSLAAGRNARVQGSLSNDNNAYELTSVTFIDTVGTSVLTPVTISLPLAESATNANEGKLVKILNMVTDSTGTFTGSKNYLYKNGSNDTITVRIESNGGANNIVNNPIPTSAIAATGILSHGNTFLRLLPRTQTDLGFDPADGTGTALLTPAVRLVNVTSVAETLTVAGDGTNTIGGVTVTIPSTWIWTDTSSKSLSGAGFGSATKSVSGNGSVGTPYVLSISGASITNINTGKVILSHLNTPLSGGVTTFTVKTRGASGILSPISASPVVNITTSGFEAIVSGNWSNPGTWSGGHVPGAADDVTMSALNVVVTIDINNAQCHDLTLSGFGSAVNSGPLLQFAVSGTPQLTVNGDLSISGGSGSGQGGRAKLTSNGNTAAVLILKHNVRTTTSNSTSSGNAGLNMNEGIVKLPGASTDTLNNGAGLRLGNLQIGDGVSVKTVVWIPTKSSTLALRSLLVKSNAIFWIGSANDSIANDIGNATSSGVPTLNGGITVETGASLLVQDFPGGANVANINLDGGGITNNGIMNLYAGSFTSYYAINIGGFSAAADSTKQFISGSSVGQFATIIIGAKDTLKLLQDVNISSNYQLTLHGTLIETPGNTVAGRVEATRTLSQSAPEYFGGIGIMINAAGAAPGVTTVARMTGIAQTGGTHSSILRYFDIAPTTNTGLNASFDFSYDNSELAGQTASTLQLWKSFDAGNSWVIVPGTNDTGNHTLSATGINAFVRWTAADPAHELGGSNAKYIVMNGWNMVSLPFSVADYRKATLFPTASSNAFAYFGGYVRKDTLQNGTGYWLKFAAQETVALAGTPRTHDTIHVSDGWNMIGSIGTPVAKSAIVQNPPGIITSQLFGFNGAYAASDSIVPGRGYWIKTNGNGTLILSTSASENIPVTPQSEFDGLNTLTITDMNGRTQTLGFGAEAVRRFKLSYDELPPVPPAGSFDVRFASNRRIEVSGLSSIYHYPIVIQAEEGSMTVSWNIVMHNSETYTLTDEAGREQAIAGNGTMTISAAHARNLMLNISAHEALPKEFSLSANYPNPFNPSTRFTIAVPKDALVNVSVYDLLGRNIATLASGEQAAGYHTLIWNGIADNRTQVSSGIYIIRMVSGTFSAVQKIIMMK